MLSLFRRGPTQKIMLVILAIALFALVATGFGTDGMGIGSAGGASGNAIANVGGEPIQSNEVSDQLNRQLERARQQQPELDVGNFIRQGALDEIVRQLIGQKALVLFGREQGLTASKTMVDKEIVAIPAFRNLAGQFDQQAFQSLLQRERITEQELREDLAGTLITQQMLLPVAGSPKVPQAMALQYASLLLEQRSGSVGLIPANAVGSGPAPSDADVAAFFQQNGARYTIPERRVLRYATFGREQVAGAAQASDAEIQTYYQANQATYGPTETRTLSQVVLPDQAAARAFAARMAGGATFAAAAQQAGFSPADTTIGQQTRAQFVNLTSEAVANAVFSAAQGATTQPVQSPLGWHVVRIEAINRSAGTPLAAARAEIAQRLGQQKQEQSLGALVTRIEDALGDGSTFEEVARTEKLTIQETPPITAAGTQFDNPNFQAPQLTPLLRTAFEMGEDEDPVVETIAPGQAYAILDIARIVPAAPPPLAQVQDRVRADLAAQRAAERAQQVASQIVAKVNRGMPLRQAFAETRLQVPPVQAISARRLDIARPNQPVPPPLAMLFSLPRGKARALEAPNGGGWFVVFLENRVPGNASAVPSLVQATSAQFEQILGQEYAAQFSRAVEQRVGVERNADALRQLRQQLLRGAAQ